MDAWNWSHCKPQQSSWKIRKIFLTVLPGSSKLCSRVPEVSQFSPGPAGGIAWSLQELPEGKVVFGHLHSAFMSIYWKETSLSNSPFASMNFSYKEESNAWVFFPVKLKLQNEVVAKWVFIFFSCLQLEHSNFSCTNTAIVAIWLMDKCFLNVSTWLHCRFINVTLKSSSPVSYFLK